ncbi:MAG: hypothetical protein IPK13_15225 [Deltaproteobacteria bacterium]|nr:hypothetical protein [Deltaproteobacteria bacterium]
MVGRSNVHDDPKSPDTLRARVLHEAPRTARIVLRATLTLSAGAFIGTILSGVLGGVVWAQGFEGGARLIGLADAQRALGTGNDAIYSNPAGMALGRAYTLELGYLDDLRGSDRRFNASIVDSQAGPISGGIAYTHLSARPAEQTAGDERLGGHRFDIAMAAPLSDSAAIGTTIRYLSYGRSLGDEKLEGGFSGLTFDTGLQWRLGRGLALGLAAYNLTKSKRRELPLSWGAGLGFELEDFSIESDVRYNTQIGKARFSGGAGYAIGGLLPVRAGVSYDRADGAILVSGGLGFIYERVSADVAYRQRVNKGSSAEDADERILSVAIRAHFL